jgi:hypothetical protein
MRLLDVSYRRFEAICGERKVKCSTHVLRVCTVIKITLSQQDVNSALQKTLKFESPLRAAAKATNSQAWLIPKIAGDKLKYP